MTRDWHQILSRLNINQIFTFLVVAEERSFRLASQRIHLSQSAVSVQVQRLELALGVPLFHRTTRSVQLTREGQVLASVAQRMRTDFVEAAMALQEEAVLQRGFVTVAATPTSACMLLPPVMRRFREQHPNVDVRLVDLDSAGALQALEQRDADLAVLARTDAMHDFEFTPLFEDEFVVIVSAASNTFEGRSVVPIEDVLDEPLLLSPRGAQTRTLADRILGTTGRVARVQQECQRPQTLLALVEHGFGVSLLPHTALSGIDLSKVRLVRLESRPSRTVGIVSKRNLSQSPAVIAFKEFLAVSPPAPLDQAFGLLDD